MKNKQPKNCQNKKILAKDLLIGLATNPCCYGLTRIVKIKTRLIRTIWFTAVLTSTVVCFYMIASSVVSYLDYRVVSVVDKVQASSIPLPQITICHSKLDGKVHREISFNVRPLN